MFTFDFTEEKMRRCIPTNKNPKAIFEALYDVLPAYDINTKIRVAGFLAQCGHESGDFNLLQENLNYSAQGLANTWPNRYSNGDRPPTPNALAKQIQRNPEAIANNTYSNRMGNGDVASGDGWRFRGRGAIGLTGRANYTNFGKTIGMTAEEAAVYCETLKGAIESSCWFWKEHNINRFCDQDDIMGMTKIINGGTIGLPDRRERFVNAKNIL